MSTVCGFEFPSAVMSSTEQTGVELAALANECGEQISECYPWQKLKVLATITGDGSTTEFDLPDDFGWIPLQQQLRTTDGAFEFVPDHDRWLDMVLRSQTSGLIGSWTVIGDQINLLNALADETEAKYYYISNEWATSPSPGLENQNGFDQDEDTFRLPDTLLRLCMIWKWKAYHGQPYAEEMRTFEIELAKRIIRDKPMQALAYGGGPPVSAGYAARGFAGTGLDVSTAFPYTLPFELS